MTIDYHDGAAVRRIAQLHYHDGAAVRNIQQAWYHDGAAVRLVFTSAVITAPNGFTTHAVAAPADASAGMSMLSNGQITYNVLNSHSAQTNWATPTLIGIGNNYWVRATLLSGTAPSSGSIGVWLALSSTRSWTNAMTGTGTKISELTFEISSDAGGVVIVSSGTFTITAEAS